MKNIIKQLLSSTKCWIIWWKKKMKIVKNEDLASQLGLFSLLAWLLQGERRYAWLIYAWLALQASQAGLYWSKTRFAWACLRLFLYWSRQVGPASLSLSSPPLLYHNLASLLPWHLNREVVCSCCHYLWQRVMKNSLPNVFGKDHRVWAGHLGVGRLLKRFERATELWAGRLKSLSGPSSCGTAAQKSLSGPLSCGPAAQKVGSGVDLGCP